METSTILDGIIKDVQAMERTIDDYSPLKDKAIKKLASAIEKMDLDPDAEKPSSIEAKATLINTMVNTIDSMTASQEKIVKLKQRLQAMDDKDSAEELAAKIISKFLVENQHNVSLSEKKESQEQSIEEVLDENEFEINEGELEIGPNPIEKE